MTIIRMRHYVPTAFGDFDLRDIPAALVQDLVEAQDMPATPDMAAVRKAHEAIETWAQAKWLAGA